VIVAAGFQQQEKLHKCYYNRSAPYKSKNAKTVSDPAKKAET
jgi:hypothetical protein